MTGNAPEPAAAGDGELDPESQGRPMQVTPEFFLRTVSEHADREEIARGVCRLRLSDDSHRRFLIEPELTETEESTYAATVTRELIDLLESEAAFDGDLELDVPVGDPDRVVERVGEESSVPVQFGPDAVQVLLTRLLVELEDR